VLKNKIYKLIKILISLNYDWYRALLLYRVAASTEHISVFNRIKNIHTIIDVGSNRGQFALSANNFFPDSRIICFEPLKSAFHCLEQVFKYKTNLTLFNFAVGNDVKDIEINISNKEDSSSILKITQKQETIFPGTEKISAEIVKLTTLQKIIQSEDLNNDVLMKIDVQGYELEVLHGSKSILSKLKYIYVESSFVEFYKEQPKISDILSFLLINNFKLDGVYNMSYDKNGDPVQADFLFLNCDYD
tara:strand:- start:131 stop:868 length:738 start_codon:yes stop_codon:yes gene_type:complete